MLAMGQGNIILSHEDYSQSFLKSNNVTEITLEHFDSKKNGKQMNKVWFTETIHVDSIQQFQFHPMHLEEKKDTTIDIGEHKWMYEDGLLVRSTHCNMYYCDTSYYSYTGEGKQMHIIIKTPNPRGSTITAKEGEFVNDNIMDRNQIMNYIVEIIFLRNQTIRIHSYQLKTGVEFVNRQETIYFNSLGLISEIIRFNFDNDNNPVLSHNTKYNYTYKK